MTMGLLLESYSWKRKIVCWRPAVAYEYQPLLSTPPLLYPSENQRPILSGPGEVSNTFLQLNEQEQREKSAKLKNTTHSPVRESN